MNKDLKFVFMIIVVIFAYLSHFCMSNCKIEIYSLFLFYSFVSGFFLLFYFQFVYSSFVRFSCALI